MHLDGLRPEQRHGELSMARLDDVCQAPATFARLTEAGFDAGVLEHALDHFAEPAGLALDHLAVAFHAVDAADDALRQVLGGGLDHGDRRAKFVRDAGDEFHLLFGEAFARRELSVSMPTLTESSSSTPKLIARLRRRTCPTAASSEPL